MLTFIKGDLFTAPKKYSLAHCIAVDAIMGAGIAVNFRLIFNQQQLIREYLENVDIKDRVGSIVPLKYNNIWIYNLITKKKSISKPKLINLEKSLINMKKHMIKNNIFNVAMPKIGSGIDKLEWDDVLNILVRLFKSKKFDILIYYL